MRRPSNPQAACDKWNSRYPIGTTVSVRRDDGTASLTVTRSAAEVLSGHTAVIWLDGISGCYLLDRVNAIAADDTTGTSAYRWAEEQKRKRAAE